MSRKDQENVYADNPMNRKLGRVGQPKGSMPVSRSSGENNHGFDQVVASGAAARTEEHRNEQTESKKVYADNAMNRKIGRVGEPYGSMPHPSKRSDRENKDELKHKENECGLQAGEDTRRNMHSTNQDKPTGSAAGQTLPLNIPPSTYVDNAYNRKLGRVGKPKGSHKVSKHPNASDQGSDSGRNFASTEKYENNVTQADKHISEFLGPSPRSCMTGEILNKELMETREEEIHIISVSTSHTGAKTYADNAYNRKLGRVGEPLGSHKISKRSELKDPCPEHDETFSRNRSSKQTKELVSEHLECTPRGGTHMVQLNTRKDSETFDDETPRKQALDETNAMHAKGKGGIKVYVDNAENRKLGRVGLPYGATPDTAQMSNIADSKKSSKVYVDNPKNRKLGRVGLPYGSAKAGNKEDAGIAPSSVVYNKEDAGVGPSSGFYKDTPQNRRLDRVGKPKGSVVFSEITKSIEVQVYIDSSLNRRLGRVGQPRGSKPVQKISSTTRKIPEMLRKIQNNEEGVDFEETENRDEEYFSAEGVHEYTAHSSKEAFEKARLLNNRLLEEMSWKRLSLDPPKTVPGILKDYTGKKIPYSELKLHRAIGKGGFGVVYFAKWNDSVIAVKKLRAENTSQRKIDEFSQEVMKFCTLNDDNVVKFIGACVELPNLCIVMEYMQMSLFDVLHVRQDIDLQDEEKLDIIRQICQGMRYLHSNRIAHCDLKPPNILMDYVQDEICDIKLSDFGLSMIRDEAFTSTTDSQPLVRNIGTPRYSAPEILRGELLSAKDMMKTDIYSLGLVCFEVIFEEEPFADLSRDQIKEQIGHNGQVMNIPQGEISDDVRDIIVRSWSLRPDERPKMVDICQTFSGCQHIFLDTPDTSDLF